MFFQQKFGFQRRKYVFNPIIVLLIKRCQIRKKYLILVVPILILIHLLLPFMGSLLFPLEFEFPWSLVNERPHPGVCVFLGRNTEGGGSVILMRQAVLMYQMRHNSMFVTLKLGIF